MHEGYEPSVPKDHPDNLFPGFQERPHDRRLLFIDSVDQLPAEPPDELFAGEPFTRLDELGKVDRLGRDHGSLVGIPKEGDDPSQGIGRIALAEEDVDQTFLFLLPSAPVGNQFRTEIDRYRRGRLHIHQLKERILYKWIFKEFGLSKMDDRTLPVPHEFLQIICPCGIEGRLFEDSPENMGQDHAEGHAKGLPCDHIDAVTVNRRRDSISYA